MLPKKSTELFINMPKEEIPEWELDKHYFEQKRNTLLFYQEEFRKIKNGVNIGGFFMQPLLYFHLNFFKTPIPTPQPTGKPKDVLRNPPLDDNILYIIDSYYEAEFKNKVLMLFGTRGFMKSTFLACLTHHTILTTPNGNFSIVGGDEGDLKSISSLMDKSFTNINAAFFIPTLEKDWDNYIKFGFKDKATSGKSYVHSEIRITNAVKGTEGASEKGAGLSPIGYIMDEVGKYAFKQIFESAIPSFKTGHGFRLTPVLSGTSGNMELVKDARELLENPDAFEILPINFDRLDRLAPKDFRTWEEDYTKTFATFVPGQMTYRLGTPKIEQRLGDYLGIKDKEVNELKINVTDWANIIKEIKSLGGDKAKDKVKDRNKMYYPTCIDECFLTLSPNPFPLQVINRRIKELELSGDYGKPVEIFKEGAEYKYHISNKRRAEVSHPGGAADAPMILYGELPATPPEKFINVSGLDDYKLNQADTDSLGAFYVIQRRNMGVNSPCEKILLSYVARPDRHVDLHVNIETGIEAFAAECLMEAIDVSFEDYMTKRLKADMWLAPVVTFAKSKDGKSNTKSQKRFGMIPTEGNNEHRLTVLVDWCWELHTIDIDEDGNKITKYSVEFIDDIDLLKELRDWKKGKNSDRKEAFSHALLHAKMLDDDNVRPKSFRKITGILAKDSNGSTKKTSKINTPYGSRRSKMNPYSTR